MKWLLILIVTINPTFDGRGGSSIEVQEIEFTTRGGCDAALQQARQLNNTEQNRNTVIHVYGFCASRE